MSRLLAQYDRRAAHGRHRCGWCGTSIDRGEVYNDQRIAADATVYTWREHKACAARAWRAMRLAGMDGDDLEGRNPREVYAELMDDYPEVAS